MTLAGLRLVLGLTAAMAASRLLISMLFQVAAERSCGVSGHRSSAGSSALFAGYIRARRTSKIDLLTAIRQE